MHVIVSVPTTESL